jgi:hypothetical protein
LYFLIANSRIIGTLEPIHIPLATSLQIRKPVIAKGSIAHIFNASGIGIGALTSKATILAAHIRTISTQLRYLTRESIELTYAAAWNHNVELLIVWIAVYVAAAVAYHNYQVLSGETVSAPAFAIACKLQLEALAAITVCISSSESVRYIIAHSPRCLIHAGVRTSTIASTLSIGIY